MTSAPPEELSKKLMEVLDALPDRAFAQRLREVHRAASVAIAGLGDLDLLRYETTSTDSSPDLSLWEEMAPVLMKTVGDVNALLSTIRTHFPVASAPPPTSGPARRVREVETLIQTAAAQLAHQVTQLGERMRSPQVVSDRWNLLAELQGFRTKFRESIADLVFDTISAFAEVSRADVVPGHREEIAATVRVRATVADLLRVVIARQEKVGEAETEDIQWHAQQLEKELDTFGKTPAYRSLRAQDKRRILEFRGDLGRLVQKSGLQKRELSSLLAPFVEFVGTLQAVNQREILVEHDREVLASCGVALERADSMLTTQTDQAAKTLAEAITRAQSLYGRDADLDAFLRKARKGGFEQLTGPALGQELERFRSLLVNLSFA